MRRIVALLGLLLASWTVPASGQLLDEIVQATVATRPLETEVAGKTARFGVVTRTVDHPFTGLAVEAWTGATGVTVDVRFETGSGWGPWLPMHVVRTATGGGLVAGYHGDTVLDGIRAEIRISVPADLPVTIGSVGTFDNRNDEDRRPAPPDGLAPLPAAASGTITPPPLVTREEWGADPFIGTPVALARPTYDYMTFHHAAGYSATTIEEGKAQVKAIQDLHQNVRGWSDIGYQFVIDRGGHLYQGRPFLTEATSLEELPVLALGAHVGEHNTGNIGISLLGCYHPPEGSYCEQVITPEAYDTYVTLFAFLSERYGVPPTRIRGHRDFSQTACPGDNNYVLLPRIIEDVQDLLITGNASLGAVTLEAEVAEDGVVNLSFFLEEDNGIASYRLERWIGQDRTVLFEGLAELPVSWADDGVLTSDEVEYRIYAVASDGRDQRLANVTIAIDHPTEFVLSESFPNPTGGLLRIRYFLREPGTITLGLYDALGRRVRELSGGYHPADTWFETTTDTADLHDGVYYYRLVADGFSGHAFEATRPVVVIH